MTKLSNRQLGMLQKSCGNQSICTLCHKTGPLHPPMEMLLVTWPRMNVPGRSRRAHIRVCLFVYYSKNTDTIKFTS